LPFRNDSTNDSTTYFLNGVMEEILNNLQKISDFSKVISRNSVEQFRNNTTKSTSEIAKKLNVNYIVEGSGQKYGNKFVLRVKLIAAGKEKHLWGKSYEQEIDETADIINIQTQIAHLIASELKVIITPEERQLIDKTSTANLTAYDFYQRGITELTNYEINDYNKVALVKAKDLFQKALKFDSTFAQSYVGLARVYWYKHYWKDYFSDNFQDSALILCDIALSLDDQLSEAFTLKGTYYKENGKLEQALKEFDIALKINPNDWMAYSGKGECYSDIDLVATIFYLQKAISINRGPELPDLLREIGGRFLVAGFPAKSRLYYHEALNLDGDTAQYYSALADDEFWLGNFNKSIELGLKGYAIDSANNQILEYLGAAYQWLGLNRESLNYYKKWLNGMKPLGFVAMYSMRRIGYSYWKNGYKKEAEYYFNEQIKYSNRMNELNRPWGRNLHTYCDLAGVYAFRGEKEKAYKNLHIYNQIQKVQFWNLMIIKTDPLFNSIRNEPEFQQIIKVFEAKYQAEHERVGKWLEEQGML
jgi:TolB-like protein